MLIKGWEGRCGLHPVQKRIERKLVSECDNMDVGDETPACEPLADDCLFLFQNVSDENW